MTMPTSDPTIWQTVANFLWIAMAAPIAFVWRKATNSVTREEMKNLADESREDRKEIKTMIRSLFDNAEKDRANNNSIASDIRKDMNKMHVDIITKIGATRNQRDD